jgi:18S rRNA (adenine1779-N6/adenine1780-N6)-dimethyltransferase
MLLFSLSHYHMQSIACLQIRLLFNRKNKTLRASLTTKAVLKLLEDNRATFQSLNPDTILDDRPIQTIVEEILENRELTSQRASKMDLDDFLRLLTDFNEAGIHFS